MFPKIQCLSRLKYITSRIFYGFFVFIVYKTNTKRKRKEHLVIDIHKLNELVIPDTYSFPLQLNIIANVQWYTNLAILNIAFFFYQWLLYLDHQYIFTIITYWEQKIFQVLISDYINLVAYI